MENSDTIRVRINGKTLWMTGTKEELATDIPDLLVSIGGFLGLFIGLSLADVAKTLENMFSFLFSG